MLRQLFFQLFIIVLHFYIVAFCLMTSNVHGWWNSCCNCKWYCYN